MVLVADKVWTSRCVSISEAYAVRALKGLDKSSRASLPTTRFTITDRRGVCKRQDGDVREQWRPNLGFARSDGEEV